MRWIKRIIRHWFCHNEVPMGKVLIIWRDVDGQVVGWQADANNEEIVMSRVSFYMRTAKRRKLEQITGMIKKDGDGNILYPLEDEDDSPPPPY